MQTGGLIDPELAADLLDAPDAAQFGTRLLAAAQSAAGVDELFAYRLRDGHDPEPVASSSDLADAGQRVAGYARRFFRRDPAAQARELAPVGSGFHCRIPAEAIAPGDYRRLCFDRPRFTEKICFGWRGTGQSLMVSFYQRRAGGPDLAQLGALAQIAMTGFTRLGRPAGTPEIERRMAARWPVLTPREVQVCARTIGGETARQIGDTLGLRPATVLTYRQRAYQKLGIGRAGDLLTQLL